MASRSPARSNAPHAGLPATHLLLALAVVAVWGTNFVVIRVALDELPPLLFATLRFCFALLPAALFIRRPPVLWRSLAAYGVLIGFGQFGLLYIAMDGFISPGLASLVVQSQVFFTIALAMWRNGERVRPFQIVALLLATAGIGTIVAHSDASATPLGLALVLCAAISWAGGNHVAKASGATNMLAFVVWASLFSIPPLLIGSLLAEGPARIGAALAAAGPQAWGAVLWQSVGNTLFGYAAWGWLLSRHPAATITPTAMLVPVFGMGASALLLGESLPGWKLAAAALVLGGLAINVLWPLAARLPGYPWRRGAGELRRTAAALAAIMALHGGAAAAPRVEEASIAELGAMMARGTSSVAITKAYLVRIAAMDRRGPALHAVIAVNPGALAAARASDARRRAGRAIGPLDGMPILIKDNIETADPIATTAGSLALKDNVTGRDAPVVAALRRAGAVILGKSNLSEWANIRSTRSMSGWSAIGGLVRNPYALDRTACGSSSGSGAGVAASLAAAALGTETDGSVICPSAMNGLVGLKPTVGLVSRTHIVPISHSQDTPGPMAKSVRDVAILLAAMIASDPADPATRDADAHRRDYAAELSPEGLRGVRIAVRRPPAIGGDLAARFDAALAVLRAQGAVLVEVEWPRHSGLGDAETLVLETELKADLDAYLATTPPTVTARTLDALIAFNRTQAAREMPYFAQETFERAARTKGLTDPAYLAARATSLRQAGADGVDAMLAKVGATMLVEPSYGPAWPSDPIYGDQYDGPGASRLPAIAGYPHLTVPMGLVQGMPVGLSFIGPAYSEGALLRAGYAYEAASHARVAPSYRATVGVE